MTHLDMTQVETNLKGKKTTTIGALNQTKGVAREKIGQMTNDTQMQLAGKKDQVIGTMQKNFGDTWAYQNRDTVLAFSLAAIVAAIVFYLVNRSDEISETARQYASAINS